MRLRSTRMRKRAPLIARQVCCMHHHIAHYWALTTVSQTSKRRAYNESEGARRVWALRTARATTPAVGGPPTYPLRIPSSRSCMITRLK